jgi:DNA polymerase
VADAPDEFDDERAALIAAARAWIEWEAELGGVGFPEVALAPLERVEREAAAPTSSREPAGREVAASPSPREAASSPSPREAASSSPREAASSSPREAASSSPREAASSSPREAAPEASRELVRVASSSSERGALAPEEVVRRLVVLASEAASCAACRLHEGRTKSVFARGSAHAVVAFVGEGPGYQEDQSGKPFVGPAGQLLDKMIAAMGLGPDEIYVCNVVKCRPPENRTPEPDEVVACSRFLREQLELVRPRVIVALGRSASEGLGCSEPGARGWRGKWTTWNGVPVMSTFHPAYLLRSPEQKRPVWNDLQAVIAKLGRTLPGKG